MSDLFYYRHVGGDRYRPSAHVLGAWNDGEQHMAPVAGLLAHAIERHDPRPDLQLARISYDVLGLIPLQEGDVAVRTLRPGRTIELVEAELRVADRAVVRATAWRLAHGDTADVAGVDVAPMSPPDGLPVWRGSDVWGGGYIASVEIRRVPGAVPGRARAWIRSDVRLLPQADGPGHAGAGATGGVSPTASFLRLVDTANGIATRADPRAWMFPNVDLTVHLFRQPVGDWVGLDTTVAFGAGGLGLTSSWLHDVTGPVGRVEQALTVRPMPGATVRSGARRRTSSG